MCDPLDRRTLYADDVKAAIEKAFDSAIPLSRLAYRTLCLRAIDSLPAAEPDAGERVAKPALIYAKPRQSAKHAWMWRAGTMWMPLLGTYNRLSRELIEVDRTASDEAALRLYDQDLAESRTSMKE